MSIVPDDLQGLLSLLEDASEQEEEEKWTSLRLSNGHLVRWTPVGPDEWRFRYGFKTVSVALETPATERTIVAALAALKGKTTKQPGRMRYAAALSEYVEGMRSGKFASPKAWREELSEDPRLVGALVQDWRDMPVALLLKELLRQHRPEFDALPEHKRTALMEQAARHLNQFLESLRKLTAFLEVGDSTAGIPKTKLKITQEQLQAAQLCDIIGLSHREIGDALGLGLSATDKRQGGHQKAKERVREGRKLLCEALGGEVDYWRYVEQEKNEVQRWSSLTRKEQYAEFLGENSGIPADSMLVIMTGDIEAAKAELAKLEPGKVDEAALVRATWEHWDLPDDPDTPVTLRADKP
jgi:hypothetical protein